MERSAWPKNLSSSRKRAIQELLHGQNPTKKLRDLFDAHSQAGNDTGQPLLAEDLIVNALRSFSNTLSLSSSSESYEVFPVPTNACVMSEVSEENESINTPVPRKTSETWTEVISNFMDDGHSWRNYVETWLQNSEFPRTKVSSHFNDDGYSWRKYGQKEILGDEFPRGYYRCTHRNVRGCLATKQIQKMRDDPPAYQTTYLGHHTCKEPHPQIPLSLNSSHNAEQDNTGQPGFSEDLVVNVLGSFSNTLSLSSSAQSDKVLQVPSDTRVMSEVSDKSESIMTQVPRITLDRRTKVSSHFNDDGYSWSKYGQKEILGDEFPRGYYRCTHRHVQGCPAKKQVQRLSYDPFLYEITYRGHHICKGPHPVGPLLPPFILDSPSPRVSSILLSYHTSLIAKQDNNDNPFSPSSTFTSVNHEQKLPREDDVHPPGHSHDDNSNNNHQPLLSDYYVDLESAG